MTGVTSTLVTSQGIASDEAYTAALNQARADLGPAVSVRCRIYSGVWQRLGH